MPLAGSVKSGDNSEQLGHRVALKLQCSKHRTNFCKVNPRRIAKVVRVSCHIRSECTSG